MPRIRKSGGAFKPEATSRKFNAAFKDFQQAQEVLTLVRSVSTVFPQFDHATGVGGFPLERVTTLHGPSNEGKTLFALGIIKSFLMAGGIVLHIDAEFATPGDWVAKILGEQASSERFFAIRPGTFEETRNEVAKFLRNLKEFGSGEVPGLIVVDSIKKLRPERQVEKMLKDEGGIDGASGRAAQHKAALVAAWLDELVPELSRSGASALLLTRESEDPDANVWAKKYGNDYKVGGGRAVFYDASLVIRVVRAGWVTKGEGSEKEVFGERHRITIRKTKIAGKDGRSTECYFHSSNGRLVLFGLDKARDLLELGKRFEIVIGDSTVAFGKHRWRGQHSAVAALAKDRETLESLEASVREKFQVHKPVEFDQDGVVE